MRKACRVLRPDNMFRPFARSLGLIVLVAACSSSSDSGDDVVCEEGQCDGLPFLEQVKGRNDPIGTFLRGLGEKGIIDSKGVFQPDKATDVQPKNDELFYAKLVNGISQAESCDPSTLVN